mgnify:CR=1 FL=1
MAGRKVKQQKEIEQLSPEALEKEIENNVYSNCGNCPYRNLSDQGDRSAGLLSEAAGSIHVPSGTHSQM